MSKTLNLVSKEVSECTKCSLAADRKQPVFGTGSVSADLMLIGEGPGAEEDRLGVPFVGRSGKLLDTLLLEEMNIDRSLCYISNVVKCRPPENRDPKAEEVEACSPYLKKQLEIIEPKVIVTLGNFATRLLLDTKIGITELRGKLYQYLGFTLIPTFHPAAALRGRAGVIENMRADLRKAKEIING
ncbi:MAG: uracil-DNA glycosylase [Acidimicrobiaceae bacterium]|nr:uracil-DNA glycosylase [Acidimicrobiaceae bacterium]